nr:hypothetical protein [Tanacetum cinerariifolium]
MEGSLDLSNVTITLQAKEVIEFGDSYKALPEETVKDKRLAGEVSSLTKKKGRTVAITAKDMQKKKNDVKARTTLLLALPNEHRLTFNKYNSAKELWEAILKTFGGNEATKKTKKNQLKQQYGNFKAKGSKRLKQTFNRLQAISYKKDLKVEEPAPKAIIAIDGIGWDWSYMTEEDKASKNHALVADEEEVPTEYALMAKSSSSLYNEGVKKEKESIDFKIENFKNSSKDLERLLESQKLDKDMKGVRFNEYCVVPPPPAQVYSPLKKLLSWMGLPEFVDDTVIDYTRPTPSIDVSKSPMIKFVKESGCPNATKVNNTKNARKPTVKYAEIVEFFILIKSFNHDTWVGKGKTWTRANHAQESMKYTFTHMSMTPRAVLLQSGTKPIAINRPFSTARPTLKSAQPKMTSFVKTAYSNVKRPFERKLAAKNKVWSPTVRPKIPTVGSKVPTTKPTVVADKGNKGKAVKALARWIWKPKQNSSSQGLNFNGVSVTFKKYQYIDTQGRLKSDIGTVVSLGNMTGNIFYLYEYEPFNEGYMSFGHGRGKITGKGSIKTGKIKFDNVYFVEELKYNMFSVSQICDNKNSVMFTDIECLVLGKDFKLVDDKHVLLRTPRQQNMYTINLKNVFPHKNLTCLIAKALVDKSMLWHKRLGHLNFKTMNKLVRSNLVKGFPSKNFEIDHSCVACLKGKQHKASCKSKLVNYISKPLHTLHMDLFGPTSVSSLNYKWYCLVVTDDFSRFTWTFFLISKDETNRIHINFITKIENLKDLNVKIIKSDNKGEFRNKEMDEFCSRKGIKREFSNARTPQQNGVAERRNRNLIEAARTMVLVIKPHNKTPYELFNERSPAIGFLTPFGCHVMILNTLDHLAKFDAKGDEGSSSTNISSTKKDVHQAVKEKEPPLRFIALPNWFHKTQMVTSNVAASKDDEILVKNALQQEQQEVNRDKKIPESSGNSNPNASTKVSTNDSFELASSSTVETKVPTVSTSVLTDSLSNPPVTSSVPRIISRGGSSFLEPLSLGNAMSFETGRKISLEFKIQNVWVLVDCPSRVRPIRTKWVLKNKKDERGIVIRNKVHLVAQGHTREEGINYEEVFAPVARIEAIRLFLAYASYMGFTVYQIDVKSAFLYGTIDEEMYVMQPPGFQDPESPHRVYKVEKAMYGLHQAPRAWKYKGDFFLVQVYVYDIIFGSSNLKLCREFEVLMHDKFQMSAISELNLFLGLQVLQMKDDNFLLQDKYVGDILKKFRYTYIRAAKTPMDKKNPWGRDGTGKDVELHLYRSMIRSLMYLTASRPDIIFAVRACARHQVTPKECHLYAVKRIFRYLKGNPKLGLWYPKESPFDLVAYSDSDYDGDDNVVELLTKAFDVGRFQYLVGEGSKHPSEPHHTPSNQDEPIYHEQITQSPQHAQITSYEPIHQSHKQTTSQEPTIPSQSHFVISIPKRITIGTIRNSQSKVPLPGADETAFPTRDVRYREAFPTDTSLDASQDREKLLKPLPCPMKHYQGLLLLLVVRAEERRICLGGCSKHGGMDQGEDLLDRDKSADKGSDSTDEMSHVLGTLKAANILDSRGLRSVFTTASLLVATTSTSVSPAVATASGSFFTAAIFTTTSVATPTTRVTRSSRGVPSKEKVLEQLSVQLARDLEAKFAQEDQIIREQAKRDFEIARIYAKKELEIMIAKLDRSNEMVAKYLSEYEQGKAGLTHDAESEEPKELYEEELKKMMELVPVEELYIKALQVKYPIIDWEIYSEGQRKCWKIIKVENHTEVYQIFKDMLKKFDRDDLDKLWVWLRKLAAQQMSLMKKQRSFSISVPTADVYTAEKFATVKDFALLHEDKIYSESKMRVSVVVKSPKLSDGGQPRSGAQIVVGNAIQGELDSLEKGQAFGPVTLTPNKVKPVGYKWVFAIKRNETNEIMRYKARLVAQGFSQIPWVDYKETYSPVVDATTLIFLIIFANVDRLQMRLMDIVTTYLYGLLDSDIYMTILEGSRMQEACESKPDEMFSIKLKRSLYRLKQSGRMWYNRMSEYLSEEGYKSNQISPYVFIKRSKVGFTIIAVYVDDLKIIRNINEIQHTANLLKNKFEMKDLGKKFPQLTN